MLGLTEIGRRLSGRRSTANAIGVLLYALKTKLSSEIELKPFPFATHYTASRTASPDGSKPWLDSHYGTADNLSHAVATHGTYAFCARETGFEQPRPVAAGAEHLQRVYFATERR